MAALRESNARDYPQEVIARVERSFSPEAVSDLLARRLVFVAVSGETIVGTASLEGGMARTVFVDPSSQGRGIGRALMAEVERAAAARGAAALLVQSSITAERFYVRLGYVVVRERIEGGERTIVMTRLLPGRPEGTLVVLAGAGPPYIAMP